MIISGKPNRPFTEEIGIDIESMAEGGKQAAEVVTEYLAEENYTSLEGLVSPECLSGLITNLKGLGAKERLYLKVKAEDVFFNFISDFKTVNSGQHLTLVTFSLPGLADIKRTIISNRQEMNETMEKVFQEAKENKVDGGVMKDSINKTLQQTKENIEQNDPHKIFKDNEILICNFIFHREDQSSEWTITNVSQVNSVSAWPWVFRKRWKGRLGISLRGANFYTVLRYDYITDWIAYLLIFNLLMGAVMGGLSLIHI